jgi:chloramphenicol O-acetyltransferase type A
VKEGWTVSRTERYVEEVLRDQAKEKKVRRPLFIRDVRFFLNTLDHSLTVMRSAGVDAKCQRVEEGDVWEYESVDALVPVLAADGEFTQILVEYRMELSDFLKHAVPLVQAAKLAPAQANPCHRADIAVFSCLPWIPFTQVASAYRVFRGQYFPLIHWGKMEANASGRMVMPVAIQANHVLVDGVHVGRFYGILEELCGNQFC